MGIQQLTTGQIQGNRIDAEIAAGQVVRQATKAHQGVFGRHRIQLATGPGHIEQHDFAGQIELQLHRAVGPMLLGAPHQGGAELLHQGRHQASRLPLHHQIQIGQAPPGVVVHPVQQ